MHGRWRLMYLVCSIKACDSQLSGAKEMNVDHYVVQGQIILYYGTLYLTDNGTINHYLAATNSIY